VDTKWRLCSHPDEDLFEDYCFDRLSEQETAIFEEHVLICRQCQKTLASTEDYIAMMKGASLAYAACVKSQRNSAAPPKRSSLGNKSVLS
jgi:uncharacterized CHY-type Zn-finger protein